MKHINEYAEDSLLQLENDNNYDLSYINNSTTGGISPDQPIITYTGEPVEENTVIMFN